MPAVQSQTLLDLATDNTPALILLGRDDSNKAHASWFDADEVAAASAAAALMGMMALPVDTDDIRTLAAKLPHGKIFGSGKAFVPFTKQAMYDALIEHVPFAQQVRPLRIVRASAEGGTDGSGDTSTTPPANPKSPSLSMPSGWDTIIPGSVVLAWQGNDEGWWEAVVLTADDGKQFTLRWRDYPAEPNFTRPARRVALLNPSMQPTD